MMQRLLAVTAALLMVLTPAIALADDAPAEHGHAAGEAHVADLGHGDDAHDAHAADHDEHWSIFTMIVPKAGRDNIRSMLGGESWIDKNPEFSLSHVFMAMLAALFLLAMALMVRGRFRDPEAGILPPKTWGAAAVFDILVNFVLGLMTPMMPRAVALRYLPLVIGLFLFILVSNLMGLVPGLLPATDNLNTTLALATVAFVLYNYAGIRENGLLAHLKHFLGPIPWLIPLMLPLEIIGHTARLGSLALRLLGNMFGDHMVLSIFLSFHILFVPLPLVLLGVLVCVVQALVFTLLTVVYISLAVESHDHDHEEGHGAEAHA